MQNNKDKEIHPWERMFKEIAWSQIGCLTGTYIFDFGSGEGITANHFAKDNRVIAIEPADDMLKNRWTDYSY